ncbi:MAG: PucR family transcriptional regulator [Tissierellia bacterium]|nr:PucR family transcriptional regulator [Tissierellia bacterium]
MSLSLKKILTLPVLQEFTPVAGMGGLDRIVNTTAILDYEPLRDDFHNTSFGTGCVVLTSLLFAKENPELILPTIQWLDSQDVSAIAYKDVLVDRLPHEVIQYCEEKKLPLFRFHNAHFENIIYSIMDAIQLEDREVLTEKHLHEMIHMLMPRNDVASISSKLRMDFGDYYICYYFYPMDGLSDISMGRLLKETYLRHDIRERSIISSYKKGYFFLTSGNDPTESFYNSLVREIFPEGELKKLRVGISQILEDKTSLDLAFRQSYFAYIGSKIIGLDHCNYDQIGTLQFFVPHANTPDFDRFASGILNKISVDNEFLETAVAFVDNNGNIKDTAKACYCHPNTIRYRIKRMKNFLGLSLDGEFEIYEILSSAIKIKRLQESMSKDY